MGKYIFVLLIGLSFVLTLSGQCPDKVLLWHRIIYLRDSSDLSNSQQLEELGGYLGKMNACNPLNDSVYTLLLMRMGALYSFKKDFQTAIALTLRSVNMIHSHVGEPPIDESQLIKAYNNLSNLYDSTGYFILKKQASDSCIAISLRLNKKYEISTQHISAKVEYLFEKGDYYHCLELAEIGEDRCRKSSYRPEDAFNYVIWQINSLIFLNRFPEASQKTETALTECLRSEDRSYLGSLLGLKATIAEKSGKTEDAIHFAMQSVNYEKKEKHYSNCASAFNNLGYDLYFKRLHQYDKALYYYNQALKFSDANDSLTILNNIANIYIEKGEFGRAFDFFQQAFNKISPNADEKIFLNTPTAGLLNSWNVEYIMNLVLDRAEAYIRKYKQGRNPADLQSALGIYKSADRLMDKINSSQADLSSQLFWRADTRRLYERAIEACWLSGDRETAFYFFEKSRAILLNNQLKEQETGDPHIMEMASIKKKILRQENQLNSLPAGTKEYTVLRAAIFDDKEQLKQLDQVIRDRNPWYYQSLIDTSFISLHSIQRHFLGKKGAQAILEFFVGDSAVYLLSLFPDSANITRMDKPFFENSVHQYNAYLSNPALENKEFGQFVKSGSQLYHLIFDSLRLPAGRMIISPDGEYFPFESLITPSDAASPHYFISDHAVSYTYSVRFLMNDFEKNQSPTSENFLGMAPVEFPAGLQLAPLPQSDLSLEKISSNFGKTHILSSVHASRSNFMHQFPGYKIIQLYTHSADSSGNGEPVIYFADSALYLSELIPENKTAARLIVLSACETGNGKLYKGEGVFSFNRGFASLGIPSSIINLWSVDNESTYRITELFYKQVAGGVPLDIALQKAKLAFIAAASTEKSLPYYWAASIIVGKTDAVKLSRPSSWLEVMIIGGILFIGIAFLLRKKK